jgi:hypothetical protein
MASLLIKARDLSEGDVLLLPFNRTATIMVEPKIGRQFVTLYTEYGKTRVELDQEVPVQARVS